VLVFLSTIGLIAAQTAPCSYTDKDSGKTYDLSPIGFTDYEIVATDGTGTFYTRFCSALTYSCNAASSVCLLRPDGQTKYNCGQAWAATGWTLVTSEPQIHIQNLFTNGTKCTGGTVRTTEIDFFCNMTSPQPFYVKSAVLVPNSCKYVLTLHTCHVCDQGCGGSGGGLSFDVGWLIIVIGISLFILYLLVGVVVKWRLYNAEGLDLIPNREFWFDLPILVKDGVFYLINLARGGYNKV